MTLAFDLDSTANGVDSAVVTHAGGTVRLAPNVDLSGIEPNYCFINVYGDYADLGFDLQGTGFVLNLGQDGAFAIARAAGGEVVAEGGYYSANAADREIWFDTTGSLTSAELNLLVSRITYHDQSGAPASITLYAYDHGTEEEATRTSSITIDSQPPEAVSLHIDDSVLSTGETTLIHFQFNEKVTGLSLSDFTASDATVSELATSDGGQSWTAKVTPLPYVSSNMSYVTLSLDHVTDLAGNPGSGGLNWTYATDTVAHLTVGDAMAVYEANSGTTTLTYTVSLDALAPTGGVSFDIATADGTATAGDDYDALAMTGVTIAAGETTYTFSVTVKGDYSVEPDETVLVNVSNVTGAVATDAQGSGTIVNDDHAPTVDLNGAATDVNHAVTFVEGGAPVSITLSHAIAQLGESLDGGHSVVVRLANASADDRLIVGALPNGITAMVSDDGADKILTLSGNGAWADFSAALADVHYANLSDNPAASGLARTITVTASDGVNVSAPATTTVTLVSVNDAPVNTVPLAQSVAEDGTLAIAGLSVADIDAGSANVQVTLGVEHGVLNLRTDVAGGVTAAEVAGNGTGSVTLTASMAHINTTLAAMNAGAANGLVYAPARNFNGADHLTVTTNDLGNAGNGGAQQDSDTVAITVTPVNDAPTVDLDGSNGGTLNSAVTYVEGSANDVAGLKFVTPFAVIGDVDNDLAGGQLVVTAHGLSAEDQFFALSQKGALGVSPIGPDGRVSYTDAEGHVFAVLDVVAGLSTGVFTFQLTEYATAANVQVLAQHLVYYNDADAPTLAPRTFDVALIDGSGEHLASVPTQASITIVPTNDAPVLADPTAAVVTFTENSVAPTQLFAGSTMVDPDQPGSFAGGSLSIATTGAGGINLLAGSAFAVSGSTLSLNGVAIGVISGIGSNALSITGLTSAATSAVVNDLLDNFGYIIIGDTPVAGDRTVTLTFNDGGNVGGGALSGVVTQTLHVVAVDDAPVAANDAGGGLETAASVTGTLLGNDSDVEGDPLSVASFTIGGQTYQAGTTATLSNGASLTVDANGGYSYVPGGKFEYLAAGATGTETFQYTLSGPAPSQLQTLGGVIAAPDARTATVMLTFTGVDNNDVITGALDGTPGHNSVSAGIGNDVVDVTVTGPTTIHGDSGNDVVRVAGTGSSTIYGDAGQDDLEGGSGNDRIYGGDDNDVIHGGSGAGNDYYDGGAGTDTLTYASTTLGVTVDLHAVDRSANADVAAILTAAGLPTTTPVGLATGAETGMDAFVNFENLTGGSGNDTLTGDDNANTIDGGNGDDLIAGAGGNDTLIGGAGIDTVSYAALTNSVQVNLASGLANAGAQGGVDTLSGFENAILGRGSDQFYGDAGDNTVEGGAGNDQLDGGQDVDGAGFADHDTAVYRGVEATDGMAAQSFDQIRINAGALGTDTLVHMEEVDFVNGAETLRVQIVNGNAVVASRDDAFSIPQQATLNVPAGFGLLSNDVNLDQAAGDQKVVVGIAAGAAAQVLGAVSGSTGTTVQGQHGVLTVFADGHYSYVADAGTKALALGQSFTDTFTYQADDGGEGNSVPATLTITINGTNDVPTLGGVVTGGVTEDVAVASGQIVTSGDLTVSDPDTVTAAGVNENSFQAQSTSTSYGTFQLATDAHWSFAADNANPLIQALGQGDTVTQTFRAVSQDGSAGEDVTVTITGTNDAVHLTGDVLATVIDGPANERADVFPTVSGQIDSTPDRTPQIILLAAAPSSNAAPQELVLTPGPFALAPAMPAGAHATTGTAGNLTDVDDGDQYSYTLVSATPVVTNGTAGASYGTLVVDADGQYHFTANPDAVNALTAGQNVTLTYTIQVSDGLSTDTAPFTVTLAGANDLATVAAGAGEVTEDVSVQQVSDGEITTGVLVTSGTVTVSDVDTGQAHTVAQSGTVLEDGVGAFSINTNGEWTYTVDNAAVQRLGVGGTIIETFEVTSQDGTGHGAVTVTVHGTNDTPVFSSNPATPLAEYQDTAGDDTFTTLTGAVTATDVDLDDELSYALTGSDVAGTSVQIDEDGNTFIATRYGTLVLSSTGGYDFNPTAAINELKGDLTLTFTVAVTDDSGAANATTTQAFEVVLHGTNDPATISGNGQVTLTEDQNVSLLGALVAEGQFTAVDRDVSDVGFQSGSFTGRYGTLTLQDDGSYQYVADNRSRAIQEIAEGDHRTDTFTVRTADGTGQTVTVTINGANDAPVVVQPGSGTLVDDSAANNARATATNLDGLFGLQPNSDVENAATVPHVTIHATATGATEFYSFTVAQGGGHLSLDIDHALAPGGDVLDTVVYLLDANGNYITGNDDAGDQNGTNPGENGLYSYLTANLAAGTYYVQVVRYGSGSIETGATFDLQVSLTNPVLSAPPCKVTLTESNDALVADGHLVVTDDVGDTEGYALTGSSVTAATGTTLTSAQQSALASAAAGAFNVDATTGAYHFNLASPDYLDAGQSVSLVYTVTVTDNHGASTTQDITYVINGANEVGPAGTLDDDTLAGSIYGDNISGGLGDDTIRGLAGNDVLHGNDGDDRLEGGSGDDTLFGEVGDDQLFGGSGKDTLYGGVGNDVLSGGADDDTLVGGAGTNTIDGGSGTDTGVMTGNYADYTMTKVGDATVWTHRDGSEVSSFTNTERFRFADGVVITPGNGGTTLIDFSAATGPVSFTGGPGVDAYFGGAALNGADRIDGGAGTNDQVGILGDYTGSNRLVLEQGTLAHVEVLALLAGNTPGYGDGHTHSYDIVAGSDAVLGAGETLTIFGTQLGAGENLTFDGSAETDGSFVVYAGGGTDTLTGGGANDGFYFRAENYDAAHDQVTGGGGTNDQMALYGNYTGTLDSHADVELLALLPQKDIVAEGQFSYSLTLDDNWIAAGEQKTIFAREVTGTVNIDGSHETNGALVVFAGHGNDTIIGTAGADTIFGNDGADVLTGGAGGDTFLYAGAGQSTGTGFDTITDFGDGDRIVAGGRSFTAADFQAAGSAHLDTNTFDQDVAAAVAGHLGTGAATFVGSDDSGSLAGQAFLVIDADGDGIYQQGVDYLVHLGPVIQANPEIVL